MVVYGPSLQDICHWFLDGKMGISVVGLGCFNSQNCAALIYFFHEFWYVYSASPLSRFPCSSTGNHRELYETDPDDSARSAGVKVSTSAAAPLWGGAPPLLHLQEGTIPAACPYVRTCIVLEWFRGLHTIHLLLFSIKFGAFRTWWVSRTPTGAACCGSWGRKSTMRSWPCWAASLTSPWIPNCRVSPEIHTHTHKHTLFGHPWLKIFPAVNNMKWTTMKFSWRDFTVVRFLLLYMKIHCRYWWAMEYSEDSIDM